MIRTMAVTNKMELKLDIPLEEVKSKDVSWYWVSFENSNEEEGKVLDSFFHFHPLAIEDCLHFLQRPKLDFYENYNFFVLHALNQETLKVEEVDIFIGNNFIVSFYKKDSKELKEIWEKVISNKNITEKDPVYIIYTIIDKLVDQYFPAVYRIEDTLDRLNNAMVRRHNNRQLMDKIFAIRADLLKLRRTIGSMRDLIYRILNAERLETFHSHRIYFTDIHDHLLKLSDMVESSREITADIRDSYISRASHHMNSIMMTLTVISSIFIPLTFLVGVYGMNFVYIPELHWKYGYFALWIVMISIAASLLIWFKKRGWFGVE